MKLLGHEFRPMTGHDFDAWAGAASGSFICEIENDADQTYTVLIYDPATNELYEDYGTADLSVSAFRNWKLVAE